MYTKCPECEVAFRITAQVLQQARGNVRCGGCGIAFNALDHLYEEPPITPTASAESTGHQGNVRSKELLETLDRLAGPDEVRVEDTGVEWLVIEEDERSESADENDDPQAKGSMRWVLDEPEDAAAPTEDAIDRSDESPAAVQDDLDTAETTDRPILDEQQVALEFAGDEPRYDDNTPLPDDFLDEDDESPPLDDTPRRRATDHVLPVDAENQTELELSEPDDWRDLLDEVVDEPIADAATDAVPADVAADDLSLEVEEELAAIHDELSGMPESLGSEPDGDMPQVTDTRSTEGPMAVAKSLADIVELADEADQTGAVAGDTPDDEPIVTAEEPSGDAADVEAVADDDQIAAAVDAVMPDDSGTLLPDEVEDGGEAVEYEEPAGEFERAIAEAEDAILETIASDQAESESAGEAEQRDEDTGAPEPDAKPDAEPDAVDDDDIADLAAMTGSMKIDKELLLAMKDENLAATMTNEDGSPVVETIVMEGDFVRGALESGAETGERSVPPGLQDPGSLVDTYMSSRREEAGSGLWRGGKRAIAAIAVLALILVVQYVHTARESLATSALFDRTIAPIYRVLGRPITPKWDIKGWQFEATNGSTGEGDEVLTIYSRIANRSEAPLPYPLVYVSLTDRYEEIVGSRVLEPSEYLAGDADPSRMVAAGGNFTAVITIASPSPEAMGFKLNVCYRDSPGQVRCAIEDFKTP